MAFMARVALRIVGENDVEDVVQDALVHAHAKRHQFRNHSHPRTWLYRITVNTALTLLRRRRRARFEPSGERAVESEHPSPADLLDANQRALRLRTILPSLPDHYRAIMDLRYVQDLTEQQVAEVLGITLANVKVRGFRARQHLRGLMAA